MSSWTVRVGYPQRSGPEVNWSKTAHWELRVEAHRGRWPTARLRRVPRAGDRLADGGVPGTLVRCPECGDGLLHQPDRTPRGIEPSEGPPWQGVAVTVAACRVLPGERAQVWQPHPPVLGANRVHQVMKTALTLGKCQAPPIPDDAFAVLDMLDAGGDIIGDYAIPDQNAFTWWIDAVDLRVASTDGAPPR